MEARKGRAYTAEPRLMISGSETEVDIKWGRGCITEPQEMITDPLSSEPKTSKEDPEQYFLKRGDTLTEKGVLTENQLRGNEKQASQVMDKPLWGL
jgi:hypothetical protein